MANTTWKSIGAIAAGFVLGMVLSVATDVILEKTGFMKTQPFSDNASWVIVIIILYRTIYNILGCYLAAKLAPGRPMRHAMIIGVIGFVLCIAGAIVMWDVPPRWYSVWLIILVLPAAWLGGRLATNSSK
jgi:hypothetical protein